jgi:hypothetical protein
MNYDLGDRAKRCDKYEKEERTSVIERKKEREKVCITKGLFKG